jgi:hypothetical protein
MGYPLGVSGMLGRFQLRSKSYGSKSLVKRPYDAGLPIPLSKEFLLSWLDPVASSGILDLQQVIHSSSSYE